MPRQFSNGDLSGDHSRARTNGSLRGLNPDCMVDGRAVLNRFLELSARSDVQFGASRRHVEDDSFLLRKLFTKRTTKLSV
jgi:hypothetical protein